PLDGHENIVAGATDQRVVAGAGEGAVFKDILHPADEGIVAFAPIEDVIFMVADDDVVQRVAGTGKRAAHWIGEREVKGVKGVGHESIRKRQILDIVRQGVITQAQDGFGPHIHGFYHDILWIYLLLSIYR